MLSPLTKSESGSEQPASNETALGRFDRYGQRSASNVQRPSEVDPVNPRSQVWQVTRTLKRKPSFRVIEVGDLRYLWAAYKKGALIGLGVPGYLTADEFNAFVDKKVRENCHFAWALLMGGKPVGFVFGAWSPAVKNVLEIVLVVWMPWASKRNIIESAVNFIREIRKEYRCMGYALPEHRGLYEVAAKHGLVRRIGTSYNAIPGRPTALFESIHRSKS